VAGVGSYLGIDIGGTKVALRQESADSTVRSASSFRWRPGSVRDDVRALADAVSRLTGRGQAAGQLPVRAAGLALPATVAGGTVTAWPSRPSWSGLDIAALLDAVLPGVPAVHEDDGNLAALAEAAATGCPDLAFLGLGTGVGGGIVLGGQLYTGRYGRAGEIGHMVIHPAGPRCACGRSGCLQAMASGPAALARAAHRGGTAAMSPAAFCSGLAAGAPWAVRTLEETAGALAVAVINLGELLQCAQVRLGGGFGSAVPGLTVTVRAQVARLTRPGQRPPAVLRAANGAEASLRGALLLARTADRHGRT
jgi:kanosamine 6-kinase